MGAYYLKFETLFEVNTLTKCGDQNGLWALVIFQLEIVFLGFELLEYCTYVYN
jgi:hypothetical protein